MTGGDPNGGEIAGYAIETLTAANVNCREPRDTDDASGDCLYERGETSGTALDSNPRHHTRRSKCRMRQVRVKRVDFEPDLFVKMESGSQSDQRSTGDSEGIFGICVEPRPPSEREWVIDFHLESESPARRVSARAEFRR